MRNPLLAPEIREMVSSDQWEVLEDFFSSTPPSTTADFLAALEPEEVRDILFRLETATRAAIFTAFDQDVKSALMGVLSGEELIDILFKMVPDDRLAFLRHLPSEELEKLKAPLEQVHRGDLLPLRPEPEPAREPTAIQPPLWSEAGLGEPLPEMNIFKSVNGRLEPLRTIEAGCWIKVVNPGKEQLELLSRRFQIPMDFLSASLDMDEIARIETEDQVTLIILKIPYFDEDNPEVPYFTLPVGVILTPEAIITICARKTGILSDLVEGRVKNFSTSRRDRFLLQLLFRATLLFLKYLKQINNAATIIQKKLEQSSKNKQLIKLLNIEKSLVYFTTSLRSNSLMLERLQRTHLLGTDDETQDLLEDIVIETKQAIEMANIYSDILSGMMDAFASIISNNLNMVMKFLTSIAIIITIPVLMASLYGMNVRLPFQESPYAFLLVIACSVVFSLAALAVFAKRDWL
jgi:magnesium transporter